MIQADAWRIPLKLFRSIHEVPLLCSFADVAKPSTSSGANPALQLLRPWAQVAQGFSRQGLGSQPTASTTLTGQHSQSQATPVSQGFQSLFTQQQPRPSSAIPQDETQFPPLAPSLRPWMGQQVYLLTQDVICLDIQPSGMSLDWLQHPSLVVLPDGTTQSWQQRICTCDVRKC